MSWCDSGYDLSGATRSSAERTRSQHTNEGEVSVAEIQTCMDPEGGTGGKKIEKIQQIQQTTQKNAKLPSM